MFMKILLKFIDLKKMSISLAECENNKVVELLKQQFAQGGEKIVASELIEFRTVSLSSSLADRGLCTTCWTRNNALKKILAEKGD